MPESSPAPATAEIVAVRQALAQLSTDHRAVVRIAQQFGVGATRGLVAVDQQDDLVGVVQHKRRSRHHHGGAAAALLHQTLGVRLSIGA